MTTSTLSKNRANRGWGAGICNSISGNLHLSASTLSENFSSRGHGGGIFNSGKAVVSISTLSGNLSSAYGHGRGGGVYNKGELVLTASTLAGNLADTFLSTNGGGLHNTGKATLKNTIIANSKPISCSDHGEFHPLGVNLIEDGSCDAQMSGDPKLGPLKDNGGLTLTHALLKGSPAIDAGRCTDPTDQRGVSRPQPEDGRCDIGAYERIPVRSDSVFPKVWPLVDFFKAESASGGIIGAGVKPGHNRLAALNQLAAAGEYRDNGRNNKSCGQLTKLLRRIDPDNSPDEDDYVTGNGATVLAGQINELIGTWNCQ